MNEADSVIYQTERQLTEFGDKITADAKVAIETAVTKLKEAHQQQNLDAITEALEEVNKAWSEATQNMNPGAEGPGAEEPTNTGNDGTTSGDDTTDDVTDVEFEEVK